MVTLCWVVLAGAAEPPEPFRPGSVSVAVLPGAERALLAGNQTAWVVDLQTGERRVVPFDDDRGTHLWDVQHTVSTTRVGLGNHIVDFDGNGRIVGDVTLEHGQYEAFWGDNRIHHLWDAGKVRIEGWDVEVVDELRRATFASDGSIAILEHYEDRMSIVGPEGVRHTLTLDGSAGLVATHDRIYVAGYGDLEVRRSDGSLVRTVRVDADDALVPLGDQVLVGDTLVDPITGRTAELPIQMSFSSADGRDGVAVVAGDREGRFQLFVVEEGAPRLVLEGLSEIEQVFELDGAVFSVDRKGQLRRWEDGAQTGAWSLPYDTGVVGFGITPDGRSLIRSAGQAIERWSLESGELELAIPTTAWRSQVGMLPDGFVTAGEAIEVRGFDLRVRQRLAANDPNRVLGMWVEDGERWTHALTGKKAGRIDHPMVDGANIADPTAWIPEAAEGAMNGARVAIRSYEDGAIHFFEGKKERWSLPHDGPVLAVLDDGRVLAGRDGAIDVIEKGKVREVWFGLPDGWAAWKDGALEVHGDAGGLQ